MRVQKNRLRGCLAIEYGSQDAWSGMTADDRSDPHDIYGRFRMVSQDLFLHRFSFFRAVAVADDDRLVFFRFPVAVDLLQDRGDRRLSASGLGRDIKFPFFIHTEQRLDLQG